MITVNYTRLSVVCDDVRLDKFLAVVFPQYSRVMLQTLISDGGVLLDGKPCTRTAQKISRGSEVAVDCAPLDAAMPGIEDCQPEALALNIIYEDEALLIINKPAGLVTHPGNGNIHGTLQSGLLHHHAAAAALTRAGIVHRLDKDTSGLLAVAKTAKAQRKLIAQFKTRQIGRDYTTIVHGSPAATGVINRPLARHRQDRLRMAVVAGGKEAVTSFSRRQQWRGFALLECSLATGRTHQIRVHLEYNGYPVVGDKVYNRRAVPLPFAADRQMLHATTLRLLHPQTDEVCEWHCPLPPDMQQVIAALDKLNAVDT